ncbi:MAG: pyruvate kinase [Bacteroidetes bacterium]|nr:pyruvate kinase [Bacteroidota bacterium]
MTRRTKIVCTLGPSSSDRETIAQLIGAGMDVARLNFSHGSHSGHAERITIIREEAARAGKVVPILQDLQGPKIRTGPVENDMVLIRKGEQLILTAEQMEVGTAEKIHVSYDSLAEEVKPGGRVLLDDGLLELEIREVVGTDVITEVIVGGPLRSRKGVHLPLMHNSRPSLTQKDLDDLEFGISQDVDIIALSFVRSETDVEAVVSRVREAGCRATVVAKIEKPEAVTRFDKILQVADGIMVARGDLGIEMPLSQVPITQKRIIKKCLQAAKPVITATQMLESMMDNPRPTRAEVSDVANAVLDGTDAVMLSGETAAGKYPVQTVEVMARIIVETEKNYNLGKVDHYIRTATSDSIVTDSVSFTAFELAEHVGAKAIVCLTASGTTARSIARHRPDIPVYAFTDDDHVVRQLALLWGTKAFQIPFQKDTDSGVWTVHSRLREEGLVEDGDLIVITAGMPLPTKGRTNMVHVSRIGAQLSATSASESASESASASESNA